MIQARSAVSSQGYSVFPMVLWFCRVYVEVSQEKNDFMMLNSEILRCHCSANLNEKKSQYFQVTSTFSSIYFFAILVNTLVIKRLQNTVDVNLSLHYCLSTCYCQAISYLVLTYLRYLSVSVFKISTYFSNVYKYNYRNFHYQNK